MIAGFGILAVLVVLVAGMSLRALSVATDGFAHYVNGINARADVASQIRTAVDRRAIAARNLVLVTKPADLELEKAEVTRAHEDVQARLRQLNDMLASATDTSEKAKSLAAEMVRVEALYGPVATNIVGLALAGKHEEAIAGDGRRNAVRCSRNSSRLPTTTRPTPPRAARKSCAPTSELSRCSATC